MTSHPERLADLLPAVVADLAHRTNGAPLMPDVYVRFTHNQVARTLDADSGATDYGIRVDLDEHGELVGVEMCDAMSVEIDGQELA